MRGRDLRLRLVQGGLLLALVVTLEGLARSGTVNPITLVPPTEMLSTLLSLLGTGAVLGDAWQTFSVVLSAFVLAVLVGVPAGWGLSRTPKLTGLLAPYIVAYYAIPVFVFYPLLITIFGFNRLPILLIAFAMSVVVVAINTLNGFEAVEEVYRDVARSMRLTRYQRVRHVELPAALPYVFTGLKLGFIYALIGVIASEFILAGSGLGYRIANSYNNFATGEMYAVMLLVILAAVTINQTLLYVEGRLYERRRTG